MYAPAPGPLRRRLHRARGAARRRRSTAGSTRSLLVAVAALPLLFRPDRRRSRARASVAIAITLLGIYWIGFALAHAVLLRDLPHGQGIVIDVLVGHVPRRHRRLPRGPDLRTAAWRPHISPNKTVEGLRDRDGRARSSRCGSPSRYQDWLPGTHALVLGIGVAIVAPIGDLFESFVKREADTKDSGGLFGAHGGALDRLDAVLFAAVVGYYIWRRVRLSGAA